MTTAISPTTATIAPAYVFNISTKLTIGGAVCFTEGISASIMAVVPKDHWFYIAATVLSLLSWVAFWQFRDNKVGADVGDLWFFECVSRIGVLILYMSGGMTREIAPVFWYGFTSISALKVIRVYLWHSSATQQYGWGRFGLMTWYHAKYVAGTGMNTLGPNVLLEVIFALIVALLFSLGVGLLPDLGRVAVGWVVPLVFEFTNGPVQLRCLAMLQNLLQASTQRETEKDARILQLELENAKLKAALQADQESKNLPDEKSAELISYYKVLPPERQLGLSLYAQLLAKNFGISNPDN